MKNLFPILTGTILGSIFTLIAIMNILPDAMIRTQVSRMDLDSTVAKLTEQAVAQGWVVSSVSHLDESIAKHGGGTVPKVRLINFCQPNHAARIIKDPKARHVSVLMPCTISVYQGDDDKIYVSSINAGLLGSMMGGTIAEVMGKSVADDQAKVLAFLED